MLSFFKKYDDDEIVNGLKGQNNRWEEIAYKQFRSPCEKYLYKKNNRLQEDFVAIYGQVFFEFIKMVRKEEFELKAKLETIIIDILNKRIIDKLRGKKYIIDTLDNLNILTADFEKDLIHKDLINLVKDKLKTLGKNCYEVIIQQMNGFSDDEIAIQLSLANIKTVQSRRYTCMQELKQSLKNDFPNLFNQ